MVLLKNSSSMARADTACKVGSKSSSLPNLRVSLFSRCPRVNCALSLRRAMVPGSLSLPVLLMAVATVVGADSASRPLLKSTIALTHAYSCWSKCIMWKLPTISRKRLTSTVKATSREPDESRTAGSRPGIICAVASKKRSRHEDMSSAN